MSKWRLLLPEAWTCTKEASTEDEAGRKPARTLPDRAQALLLMWPRVEKGLAGECFLWNWWLISWNCATSLFRSGILWTRWRQLSILNCVNTVGSGIPVQVGIVFIIIKHAGYNSLCEQRYRGRGFSLKNSSKKGFGESEIGTKQRPYCRTEPYYQIHKRKEWWK